MTKGLNFNHPKKGSKITVQPITTLTDIATIRSILANSPRDLALFTLGINTNLRASDLTRITVAQVIHLKPMDILELKEKKTGKLRRINLNHACIAALQNYLLWKAVSSSSSDRLFPLSIPYVNRLVKKWCRLAGLSGNFGSHTLRKTWGFLQRTHFGVDVPTLMVCFGHTTQAMTLRYLCIQPEEIKAVYGNQL